jgi:UDP-2,3-diacylglucosamine hydrolase
VAADHIMDVTPAAVVAAFEASGVRKMIHGHTHRPGTHRHSTALGEAERVVLAAWDAQGEYLEITAEGWQRKVIQPCKSGSPE